MGELFANKAVSQSLRAKRNAVIYDFLLDDRKKNDEMCSILDLFAEEEAAAEISDFFCSKISSGEYSEMNFSFEKDIANGGVDEESDDYIFVKNQKNVAVLKC